MKKGTKQRTLITVAAVFVLIVVGFFAWRQTAVWKDDVDPTQKNFLERVDRGLRPEDRAVFEKQIEDLRQEWETKRSEGTRDVNLLLRLGNAYYAIGELKRAAEQYQDILSTHPTDAPALENLGQTQLEMGDYLGAEMSWVKATDAYPNELTYIRLTDLINSYIPEHHARVKDALEHGIANLGQTYTMLILLGDWYASEDQYDRAVSHYEVALQLSENEEARKQLEEYRRKLREQQINAMQP